MTGYLVHPLVGRALVLEHGCEKTHNDAMRNHIAEHAIDAEQFGWASIQLDGGLEKVTEKWGRSFGEVGGEGYAGCYRARPINVALVASEKLPPTLVDAFARLAVRSSSVEGRLWWLKVFLRRRKCSARFWTRRSSRPQVTANRRERRGFT